MIDINHLNDGSFSDLSLEIAEIKKDFLGDYEIIAKALYNKEIAGIKIILRSTLKPGIADGKINMESAVKGGIQIKSIGKESDCFVQAVANYYKQIAVKPFTIKSVVANAVVLSGKPFDILNEKISVLAVFDPDNKKSGYSELFIEFDFSGKTIHIKEKNMEWRENFIRLLTT